MYLLIAYDVDTSDREGERRLRRVAKICEGFGQRVQKSVFEVDCSPAQQVTMTHKLTSAMRIDRDSLRIYTLPGTLGSGVQTFGLRNDMPSDSGWTL